MRLVSGAPIPCRPGLGTAPLGSLREGPLWWGPQDRDEAVATVVAAIDAGVAFVDTAPFYGWGRAESIVGDALGSFDVRPTTPILTKCGTVPRHDGAVAEDASPESVRRDVEASLERLGVDRIDIVQVHDPDPATPIEVTWETLMALVDEGVIGGAGLSNHPVGLLDRALAVGPVDVVQCQYSLLWRGPEIDGVLEWCGDRGVTLLAWAPLASGFLADGFDLGALDPTDLRHGLRWASDPAVAAARGELARVAADRATTMADVAAGWLLRAAVRPIVGARSVREATALGSMAPLDPATRSRLAALAPATGS